MSTIHIRIRWDGDTPSLRGHRLSLTHFGEVLTELPKLIRRIGSGLITGQPDDEHYGTQGGKYAAQSMALDVELAGVEAGCAIVDLAVTMNAPPAPQSSPFPDNLPLEVSTRFIREIARANGGEPALTLVKQWLQQVPAEVSSQTYAVYQDGRLVDEVHMGPPPPIDAPTVLPGPRIYRVTGLVAGVGFEPNNTTITLAPSGGGRSLTCAATPPQVELALESRGQEVQATIKSSGRQRTLLWLRPSTSVPAVRTPDEMTALVEQRWDAVMGALALGNPA